MEVENPLAPHTLDLPLVTAAAFYRDLEGPALAAAAQDPPSPSNPEAMEGPQPQPEEAPSADPVPSHSTVAAVKLQKVYRSYRTRRKLADSVVVAEEIWWQVIDSARLNHDTISFFDYSKPESPHSKWHRVKGNASKVGKGLAKDDNALKLAFEHWIEAIDPRHRYGHNLHFYYEEWCKSDAGQPFFYWLDVGDGKNVDLDTCSRSRLREQVVAYLGPQEREAYEYVAVHGIVTNKVTGEPLDTTNPGPHKGKWIFVMSPSKKLYAGLKKKGYFHHSSFLAGGATIAAGRLKADKGILQSISAYSGHYKPTEENLKNFLDCLTESGIDRNAVKVEFTSNEDYYDDAKSTKVQESVSPDMLKQSKPEQQQQQQQQAPAPAPSHQSAAPTSGTALARPPQFQLHNLQVLQPLATVQDEQQLHWQFPPPPTPSTTEASRVYKRTTSGGLQSPRTDVPRRAILQRIESKKNAISNQLGHQVSSKWSTGAGPRIGCVADYPKELRLSALEFVNLSPRHAAVPTPGSFNRFYAPPFVSPRLQPTQLSRLGSAEVGDK